MAKKKVKKPLSVSDPEEKKTNAEVCKWLTPLMKDAISRNVTADAIEAFGYFLTYEKQLDQLTSVHAHTSFPLAKLRAENGEPIFQVLLYQAFRDGRGCKRNTQISWHWLIQAAQNGIPAAIIIMAIHTAREDQAHLFLNWCTEASKKDRLVTKLMLRYQYFVRAPDGQDPTDVDILFMEHEQKRLLTLTGRQIQNPGKATAVITIDHEVHDKHRRASRCCCMCGMASKKWCGKCRTMRYCSASCQRADWPQHKQCCFDKASAVD